MNKFFKIIIVALGFLVIGMDIGLKDYTKLIIDINLIICNLFFYFLNYTKEED